MKTQLTAEQSAKLIELGVNPKRASDMWVKSSSRSYTCEKNSLMLDALAWRKENVSDSENYGFIFTLADILDMLPKSIKHGGYAEAKLNIYTRPHRRECWVVKYIVSTKTIPYDGAGCELIDALYEVLYKLLDNHVKLD